ncbi:helix-turn-helix transcriptional regulator [Sphingopyxis sp. LARHCG72]
MTRAIRDSAEAQSNASEPESCLFTIQWEKIDLPMTAVIASGPKPVGLNAPLTRTAVIMASDPAREMSSVPSDLCRLFDLTGAEAELAIRLTQGLDPTASSQEFGITRNTARSQLRSAFQKIRANRQSDLVRLIQNSSVSCRGFGRGEAEPITTGYWQEPGAAAARQL